MMMKGSEGYCHEDYIGLACPPIDDYVLSDAFFFGDTAINLDPSVFFANLSKQENREELYPPKKKPSLTSYTGKGKEWKQVVQVLQPTSEMLAKVNTSLEPLRCRLAVQGVIVPCTQPVTKPPRKTIKIIVKKQVNVTTATKKLDVSMPMNEKDFERKLDATKRKFRDFYDHSNKLKKQRMTQLVDWRHLPPMPSTNKKCLNAKPRPNVGRTTKMGIK